LIGCFFVWLVVAVVVRLVSVQVKARQKSQLQLTIAILSQSWLKSIASFGDGPGLLSAAAAFDARTVRLIAPLFEFLISPAPRKSVNSAATNCSGCLMELL
jgi:hypothetical protein